MFVRREEIAVWAVAGDAAFVGPKEVDVVEAGGAFLHELRDKVVKWLRDAAAGEREAERLAQVAAALEQADEFGRRSFGQFLRRGQILELQLCFHWARLATLAK